MNYIYQLNAFYAQFEDEPDPEYTFQFRGVYLALLNLNNRSGWKVKFTATYSEVYKITGGIAKKTYYNAIRFLVERGQIIYFKSTSKHKASYFTIVKLYKEKDVLKVSSETDRKPIEFLSVSKETHRKLIGNRYETDTSPIPKPNKPSKVNKPKKELDGTPIGDPDVNLNKFIIPSEKEILNYMVEEKNFHISGAGIFAGKFWNFYNSNGWKVGKNNMKNWRSAVATWLSGGEYLSFVRKETAPPAPVIAQIGANGSTAILTPPAPVKSKEAKARDTYAELLIGIRKENHFSELYPWGEVWLYLHKKGRTDKISPKEKDRIKQEVTARLNKEAQEKAKSASPIQRPAILADALNDLEYQCKRQYLIEYFTKYIKP